MFHKTRVGRMERLAMAVMHVLRIVDALVFFGSLTFYGSDFTARWIFSETCDKWSR